MVSPIEQCSKSPLSFHYTGWFIGIPLLDYCNPQHMKGSIIPQLNINQQGFRSHCSIYPLVICYIAIESGHRNGVSFPMKNGWIFPSFFVNVYGFLASRVPVGPPRGPPRNPATQHQPRSLWAVMGIFAGDMVKTLVPKL